MTAKFTNYQPMSHTQAPIENRMANVYAGSESYFTDDEARQVLPELARDFRNVIAVRNCPHAGFTRLAAHNVNFQFHDNGVRFVNGEAL